MFLITTSRFFYKSDLYIIGQDEGFFSNGNNPIVFMRVVTIGYNWWVVVKIGGFVFSMAPSFNASYIATPVGLASFWPMLAGFQRRHPQLRVRVSTRL